MSAHLESPDHPLHYIQNKDFHMTRSDCRSVWLDYHLAERFAGELPSQKEIVAHSMDAGLPEIQVGPFEGHLILLMLQMMQAKRGIEIGTLGGYSASWICRAIEKQEGAHLDCLEMNSKFAEIANENLAPWKGLFEIHVGPAQKTLEEKFSNVFDLDFVFIDADKAAYPAYFEWAWAHIRKGGVILLDNFYARGAVYFGKQDFPSREKDTPKRFWEHYSETQRAAMKLLWQRLEDLGDEAEKTILPTSEGLGIVRKR